MSLAKFRAVVRHEFARNRRHYSRTCAAVREHFKFDSIRYNGDKTMIAALLKNATMQVIYQMDKSVNDHVRGIVAGTYVDPKLSLDLRAATVSQPIPGVMPLTNANPPRKTTPVAAKILAQIAREANWLESLRVFGRSVASMTGADVRSYLARERGQADEHGRNAEFFKWLSGRVPDPADVVGAKVDPNEARKVWTSIMGSGKQ